MKAIMFQRGRETLAVPDIYGIATDDMDTTLCTLNYIPDVVILDSVADDYKDDEKLNMWLDYFDKILEATTHDLLGDGLLLFPPKDK